MVEAVMLWNEPNNLSHWDFDLDPGWRIYRTDAIGRAMPRGDDGVCGGTRRETEGPRQIVRCAAFGG